MLEQFQGPSVLALGASHATVEPRYCFHVVVENFGSRIDDAIQAVSMPDEIGGEDLDRCTGSLSYSDHAAVKVLAAAIGQVVARDRGDNDVFEAESGGGLCDSLRFILLKAFGATARDRAKPARPSADVSEDHERGGFLGVALHAVWAFCILANRLEFQFAEQAVGELVPVPFGDFSPEPGGQSSTRFEQFALACPWARDCSAHRPAATHPRCGGLRARGLLGNIGTEDRQDRLRVVHGAWQGGNRIGECVRIPSTVAAAERIATPFFVRQNRAFDLANLPAFDLHY